jgi:hypothetical protein
METIDRIDAIIHYNIGLLVDQAMSNDENYFDKSPMERYEVLRGLAALKVVSTPVTPTQAQQMNG